MADLLLATEDHPIAAAVAPGPWGFDFVARLRGTPEPEDLSMFRLERPRDEG